jgi:hypothetical protein
MGLNTGASSQPAGRGLILKIIQHALNMLDNLEGKDTAARQHGGGMLIVAAGLTPKYQ